MTPSSFHLWKVKRKKGKPTKFPKNSLPCKVVRRGGKENEMDESVWVSVKKKKKKPLLLVNSLLFYRQDWDYSAPTAKNTQITGGIYYISSSKTETQITDSKKGTVNQWWARPSIGLVSSGRGPEDKDSASFKTIKSLNNRTVHWSDLKEALSFPYNNYHLISTYYVLKTVLALHIIHL